MERYDLVINEKDKTFTVNGEVYFSGDGEAGEMNHLIDNPKLADVGNKNWYLIGSGNIYIHSEGSDYGLKILTRGSEYTNRYICGTAFKPKAFLWLILNENQLDKICSYHQALSEENLAPECQGLVEFNYNGQVIFGLKMEHVHANPHEPTLGLPNFKEWKDKLIKALQKEKMKRVSTQCLRRDLRPCNVKVCKHTGKIMYLDIEYRHLPKELR